MEISRTSRKRPPKMSSHGLDSKMGQNFFLLEYGNFRHLAHAPRSISRKKSGSSH